jgi:hypothetical protein
MKKYRRKKSVTGLKKTFIWMRNHIFRSTGIDVIIVVMEHICSVEILDCEKSVDSDSGNDIYDALQLRHM